jgi:hypothetical protein
MVAGNSRSVMISISMQPVYGPIANSKQTDARKFAPVEGEPSTGA